MPTPAPSIRQRWQRLRRDPQFLRGMREMLPMLPGITAWGLVTGVAMVKSGLSVPLALLMSLLVYAGSSQLASLPLIAAQAPAWVIWLTAFVVNLRFVIYSVQWRLYFGGLPRQRRLLLGYFAADMNLAMFTRAWPEPRPQPGQQAYLLGGVAVLWPGWQVPSVLGIVLADAVPPAWGLGFAGTLALLALTCSLLIGRATWVSAGVASLAAVAAVAMPYKLNIVVAVAAAVAAGLMMERIGGAAPARAGS
ncbi:putative branched-subunit amino acid permease [Sphaerotilus hippei]|uniref:Putative branched-subunit amino acid permease n=1 Tax=Sphaerotilus hippei TaxID=744406 RepID=A0A318H810_9BURK|nr:AzlC family ABC transporter permease [Sphaerotilus hippei]PXW95897.1 putative branched-subunit amino acid permease [Sphaerotilus hippei]